MKRTRVGMLIFPDVERLVNINASAPSRPFPAPPRPFPAPPFPGHHAPSPAAPLEPQAQIRAGTGPNHRNSRRSPQKL